MLHAVHHSILDMPLATATSSCTNGVVPVCGRPWYPPVSMPAPIWINQNFNLSAKSCLFAVLCAPGALYGSRSTYKVAQCTWTFTMITVVTPWIRSLLFQLTMADPVKVMLVTYLNHLIAYHVANYDWPFGTLPLCTFSSNLDTRDLETYPRSYSGHFWNMSLFGNSRAIWVLFRKWVVSENQSFLDEGVIVTPLFQFSFMRAGP